MRENFHQIRVTVPEGRGIFGRVEIDGEELRGVTAVAYAVDAQGDAQITLRLFADLLIEGEAAVVLQWRQGLPWWRRLPYWLKARP